MLRIKCAVGKKGANLKADVKIIQLLINQKIDLLKPQSKLIVDGIAGDRTIEAISNFQRRVCNFSKPDGRVDPGGKTFQALTTNFLSFSISGASIPPEAMNVLTEILIDSGLSTAIVSSGMRTSADQARVMYDNIKNRGIEKEYNLYGSFGDKVIKVYEENATRNRAEVIAMMQAKIEEIGPEKVSSHCSNAQYVFDVAPSSIKDHIRFAAAVKRHKAVSNFLQPPADRAFHIEIPKDSPLLA